MGTVSINGQTFTGGDIRIEGNKVFIDGKEVIRSPDIASAIEVRITGGVMNVSTDKAINCDSIEGDARAGGSINCDDIGGNAMAGGSINCGDIGGSATAGGSVRRS